MDSQHFVGGTGKISIDRLKREETKSWLPSKIAFSFKPSADCSSPVEGVRQGA